MSSSVTLKALGLSISQNALDLPNGSMSTASNVIIKRADVVEQRRGYKLYGTLFGSSNDRVSQLFSYKQRILRQYATSLQYDSDGSGIFSTFNGSYSQAQTGLRTKSIESNGNLYFTSSEGIKLISAASSSDFTTSAGFITNAGVPKAIDFTAAVISPTTGSIGFLPQDSTVAYKTTWATKDANTNLKIGSPSQSVAVYNALTPSMNQDFMNVLEALDNVYIAPTASFFSNYGNYVNSFKVLTSDNAVTLRTNLINLTVQIDDDIRFANTSGAGSVPLTVSGGSPPIAQTATTVRITFSAGNPTTYFTNAQNKKVKLSGFGTISGKDINGYQTITTVTATYIEFELAGGGMTPTNTGAGGNIRGGYFSGSITIPGVPSIPATASQLAAIQTYLESIISGLQSLISVVISTPNQTAYIAGLSISSDVNVRLAIQIPQDVVTNDNIFLQIYRSTTVTATFTDILDNLVANGEETQLVYEAYPTSAELSAGVIIVDDITSDIFKGANLYTNQNTGDGILQANDIPPFALDINRFKNVVFYANTKTRHRVIPFSLLGVSNLITDANNSITPTITIANGTITNTYTFTLGISEVTTITCVADVADNLNGKYFLINSANNATQYYVWYKTSGASAVDPAIAGKTGIKVNVLTNSAANTVASRTRDVLNSYISDFSASVSGANLTITNVNVGYTTDSTMGTSGFTLVSIVQGTGESISNKSILLSQDVSPAVAVDETARSMVRVINGNSTETVYAFYISTLGQVPGKMVLESRTLTDTPFYIIANDSNVGASFFPSIAPIVELGVSAGRISVAYPTIVTSAGHGLTNNDQIVITNSNSTLSINGVHSVTYVSANTFSLNINVTVAGTKLSYSKIAATEVSTNEVKPNRIYYSKVQQPESVPIVNYLDVGAADKSILRIFPLRDSLFIFKQDGLFRISGEVAPFYVGLFDSSCIVIAPDSVAVSNNLVYAYTRQGISTISEAGASTISRSIDTDILKFSSDDYTNFETSTWGVGYESDNSYTVFTVNQTSDDHAAIGYRYSNLTNTWTTVDKDSVCGILNPADDKLYLGAGDTNYIEQERKSFSRLDYADREIAETISNGGYMGSQIQLAVTSGLAIGDVVVQDQSLTVYKYNALLKKLDIDAGVTDTNYYSTLKAVAGDNLRTKLEALTAKLDADAGVVLSNYTSLTMDIATKTISGVTTGNPSQITTSAAHGLLTGRYIVIAGSNVSPTIDGNHSITLTNSTNFTIAQNVNTVTSSVGTVNTLVQSFQDILGCFNIIIDNLNIDTGVAFSNYNHITGSTSLETVITAIDTNTKRITLQNALDFVVGPVTVFKSITSTIIYSPNILGDPLGSKHLSEATMMFTNKAFTTATLSFASDLLPKFEDISFSGDGNGIFGSGSFGAGYFGGASNSPPFRTYIPRNCQRCRYIVVKFVHSTARESYAIYGVTITGEVGISTRAFR